MAKVPGDEAIMSEAITIEAAIAELYRLANSPVSHRARQRRLGTDLSRTELEALRRVDELEVATVTTMSEVLGLSLAATSRTLARLEDEEYLVRRADPDDGRVVRFETTAKGSRTSEQFQASTRGEINQVLSHWPERDRSRLAELFSKLVVEMRGG